MYIYLFSLVALEVLLPESVSSTRYCFEYCRYVFYTKQPTLDPRCDCSGIAEVLARFVSQSPSTLADHQALALPQNDYKEAASYPIKIIPYSEQRYLVQKPISKYPLMKDTDEIKINNNSSVKRPKKGKCKKRNHSKTDKLVVDKPKHYTAQSDKDPFKMPRMRTADSVVGSEFDQNYTVSVELNQTQSATISKLNDSDAVHDKLGHVDSHENNTLVEAPVSVSNNLTSNIEDITTKQESDYFKEQNSQLTTNTPDDIVILTKNSKPTNGNDTETMPFVFKFHNDEDMPTTQDNPVTTTKTSENYKNTTSSTPSYIYNNSATLKNDINRETYNEREVPLQKIITKELTNGSVLSYINGTENVLHNEFIDNNSSDDLFSRTNIIADFKNDKPPQLLNSTKSESRKTPIAATFNFIFVSFYSKIEEISDDKILS